MKESSAFYLRLILTYVFNRSAIVVQLAEEDVKIITEECEISKDAAEALLRNFNGNLKEALRSYIAGQ